MIIAPATGYWKRSYTMLLKHRAFVAFSLVIVALMYVLPFYWLKGTVGPETLLFWVAVSAVYLAIVVLAMRGDN